MSAFLPDNMPFELRQCDQWGLWRYEQRGEGKPTKVPYSAVTTAKASVTTARDWTAFAKVCEARELGRYDGIGFVLTDADAFTAIDVDNVDPANLTGFALEIAQRFNTYTEISPSGHGLRIFVKGKLPGKGVNNRSLGVEMYDRERYVTVTGNVLNNVAIREAQADVDWLYAKLTEGRTATDAADVGDDVTEVDAAIVDRINADPSAINLRHLSGGAWQGVYPSQSEADMALCNALARYTHNPAQLARLFRMTALGQREKATRDNYVMPMAQKAIAATPLKPTAEATEAAAALAARMMQGSQSQQPPRTRLTHYSASALRGMTFAPTQFVVANLIPQGLTLLAGKPKSGKSWLALDIAAAVATGGEVLSSDAASAGDVLYAALEDTAPRMQSRLTLQREGLDWPDNLTLWHEMQPLDRGGEAELRNWIAAHPNAKLIIIDVLKKVRPAKLKNEDPYDHDYRTLMPLKKISDETGVSVIVIHHTRKAAAEDIFDTVNGTLGLTGAADMTVILTKDKEGALILAGQGRDVEEFIHGADFDENRRLMLSELETSGGQSGSRNLVIGAMRFGADTVAGICKFTQLSDTVVRSQLQRMVEAREAFSPERGKFLLPPVEPSALWQQQQPPLQF